MKEEFESPVYHVHRVPVEKVRANSYNPNHVAAPEMKLLELSIWEDGYTMPCVCYYIPDEDIYELVDGYHRYCVLKTSKRVFEREKGLLPVVVIEKDLSNRMASTIRHNRARGTHSIELMVDIENESLEERIMAVLDYISDIWKESGEWCKESIWEINYEDGNNERGWSSWVMRFWML